MRKLSCCRLQLLLTAILLLSIVVFTESCRKADTAFITPQIFSETENKFFNSHRSGDAREKALVDFLKRRNESSHFVETAVKRIGYPRWNKAITIATSNNTHNQIENEDNNGSVTYIPFVRDSQNYVNATMAVYTSAADTSFSYISDWQYADYGFAAQPDSTDAKDIFHLFTRMDNAVFGTTAFKITDHRLLTTTEKQRIIQWGKHPDSVQVYYELKNAENGVANELLTPVETCTLYDVTVTFECPPGGGGSGGCGCLPFRIASTSTETEPCWFSYQYEECTITWVYSGGGTGSGGGNPGSGGGDTPPGDEPGDCNSGPVAAKAYDPCGSGWEPIPTDDPPAYDPCTVAKPGSEKATAFSKNDKFSSGLADIKAAATDGKERTVSFGKDANGNVIRSVVNTGTGNSGSVPNIENRFADMHNHPGNKPPSSGDIYGFIDQVALKGSSYQRFVTLPDGTLYALVITDMEAAKKFNTDYPRQQNPGPYEPTFPVDLVDELNELNYNAGSQENGLAFFLDKYKTGISLLKLDTDEKFKRVNVTYAGKDQYGSDIYNASLCN